MFPRISLMELYLIETLRANAFLVGLNRWCYTFLRGRDTVRDTNF